MRGDERADEALALKIPLGDDAIERVSVAARVTPGTTRRAYRGGPVRRIDLLRIGRVATALGLPPPPRTARGC